MKLRVGNVLIETDHIEYTERVSPHTVHLHITRKKDANLQRTVSGKTPRVSLSTSARDRKAWQKAGLY